MRNPRVRILTECALMVALAFLLARIPLFHMPFGGTVTLFCGMPIFVAAYRHGLKWGVFSGFVLGLLEMMMGFQNVLWCTTLWAQIGCVLLDYLVAFSVLGLAGVFHRKKANIGFGGYLAGGLFASFLRYLCSFLSGVLLWSGYAADTLANMGGVGQYILGHFTGTGLAVVYSAVYNACYMLPEGVLTALVFAVVAKTLLPRLPKLSENA